MASRTVATVLTLKDRMSSKIAAIEKASGKAAGKIQGKCGLIGKKFKDVGRTVEAAGDAMTIGLTAPIVGAGTVAAKKFAEVDKTMQLVKSTMGDTKFAAADLNQAMKDAAANSVYGMDEAANAALNFARGGWDAEQAAVALAPAMNLAAGEGGDLETVSAGLMATMNAFGADAEEAGHYADVFANACNNSALDVNALSDSMSVASASFSNVEDAALAMGVMADRGVEASVAANALKSGMGRLADPAKAGAKWMEQLGIDAFDSSGNMKSMVTIQEELHNAFDKLSDKERKTAASAIFGKNQMNTWLQLIDTAPGHVKELSGALKEEETASKMADDMMSGFGGSIEKLKSSVDVLATSFGETLAPYIQIVIDKVQAITDKFNALSDEQKDTIVKIGMIVAAVGPALVIVGKIIGIIGTIIMIGGKVIAGVKAATAAIGVMNAVIAANPIILIIMAIIAVVVLLGVICYKYRDKIKAIIQNIIAKVKLVIAVVKLVFKAVVEAIKAKIQAIKDKFTELKEKVKGIFVAIGQAIKDTLAKPFNWIKEKAEAVGNFFKGIVDKISGAESEAQAAEAGQNATGTTYWKGGRTWVGENGPELVDLPKGSKVYPHGKSMNMKQDSRPVSVSVVIQGNVIGNREFADQVGETVAGKLISAMGN